ncbi:hypothetical protein AB0C27_34140 [Nonomuraea sp. NPDC048882]|uniref:hypothetical protein n=1 Tax=Nonomuraea sp. NPDC048882 TaxID=3154347 RepID=UPI0033D54D11
MSTSNGENEFLYELHIEIEEELIIAEASHAEDEVGQPITEWLYDPTDVEREKIALRGLRDAVEVLEDGGRPGDDVA